jgi:hypothetical protein
MAVITPTSGRPTEGVLTYSYTMLAADTAEPIFTGGYKTTLGCLQSTAVVALEGSNDNVTWSPILDGAGDAVVTTANSLIDFSTAAVYLRITSAADNTSVLAFRS